MKNFLHIEVPFLVASTFKFLSDRIRTNYRKIVGLKSKIVYDAWVISKTKHDNENIRVLYVGKSELDRRYICNLIFHGNSDEFYLGKMGVLRVLLHLCGLKKNYDLVVFNSRAKICTRLKTKKSLMIPVWIRCEISLDNDVITPGISKRTLKTNLKILKRGKFDWVISKDPVDFEYFYYKLFLPYISNRHGSLAFKQCFSDMKKNFENGELMLIKEGKTIVAGGLIDYKKMNGVPLLSKIGVYEGDYDFVKRGALVAVYYYTIKYLKGKKHKKLSLGSARPFLNDGILRYKLNWGAKIVCDLPNVFLLTQTSEKDLFKRFLSDNPFLMRHNNNQLLAISSDQNYIENKYLPKDKKQLWLWGLDGVTTFSGSSD